MGDQSGGSENAEICLLCDEPFGTRTTSIAFEQSIHSFIAASKKRLDNRHKKLTAILKTEKAKETKSKVKTSIKVHKTCRSSYISDQSIEAHLNKRKQKNTQSRRNSVEARNFDFNTLCFYCGGDASDDFIQHIIKQGRKDSAEKVRFVSKAETGDNIIATLKGRNKNNKEHVNVAWYKDVHARIKDVDLVDSKARYHVGCMKRFYAFRTSNIPGRPADPKNTALVEFIISFVEKNAEECQFSLKNLITEYKVTTNCVEIFDLRTIRDRLETYFGDDISIYSFKGDYQFCFINDKNQILRQAWINDIKKTKDSFELKQEIVKSAARIILNETRQKHYDIDEYPAPHYFLDNVDEQCPYFLKIFLEIIIKSHKKESKNDKKKWDNRVLMFTHCLVSSMRPRAFISPLMLGLSTTMHKKHASRNLIDSLAYLGFCESYRETLWFQDCIVQTKEQYSLDNSYLQFIFDNTDHNTNTPDGRNTFHATGGIMCATPAKDIVVDKVITRLKDKSQFCNAGNFGLLSLQHFVRKNTEGLNAIKLKDVYTIHPVPEYPQLTYKDCLWFYGRKTNPDKTVGWNGLMELCADIKPYKLSKIIAMPFLMNPITSYDSIFTVLLEADARCKARGQKHVFVTFDLPPYIKAQEIMACLRGTPLWCKVSSVILRLGGFHTAMSYAGSVGTIMDGSGLYEAFCQIFAENSAAKALTGKAWARCFRGHVTTQASIVNVVLESIEFDENEQCILNEALDSIGKDTWHTVVHKERFESIVKKFKDALHKLKKNGPTAELWIQYIDMTEILKQFVEAERTGNWALHLQCVQQMLPYLHAAGHTLYAKYLHLYLQQMLELAEIMDPVEFKQFTEEGFFTIRKSDKFRSGIWSDMTIEQSLMRPFKEPGGMTRGRGITENNLIRWIISSVAVVEVIDSIESFTNVHYETSEQHIDITKSRVNRDAADLKKMDVFFKSHNPFPETPKLISIATGIVGNESINCHRALEIGMQAVKDMADQFFGLIKMTRKNKVKSLKTATCSVKVDKQTVTINPMMIYHRILMQIDNKDEMKGHLCHELAPFVPSLFNEVGFRKGNKADFYKLYTPVPNVPWENESDCIFVIDGGYLLHKVVWTNGCTVKVICSKYVEYVINHYSVNSHVVFDGYPTEDTTISTKTTERLRRQNRNLCCDYEINIDSVILVNQDKFLSNEHNKRQLIELLCEEFKKKNVDTTVAEEDADTLIVKTGIELSTVDKYVVIVGEDTDLLVILTHHAYGNNRVLLLKPAPPKGKTTQQIYSSSCLKNPSIEKSILFLHAMTGCDTTSCFYNRGKLKLAAAFSTNSNLRQLAEIYYVPNAEKEKLFENGIKIIRVIYGESMDGTTLNDVRYIKYRAASASSTSVKLEALPPTENAARQHCFRVYHQVQAWLGNKMDATNWGWQMTADGLRPIMTEDTLIPHELLNIVRCGCKSGCNTQSCSCRKHGMVCTDLCSDCHGQDCSNSENVVINENMIDLEDNDDYIDEIDATINQVIADSMNENYDEEQYLNIDSPTPNDSVDLDLSDGSLPEKRRRLI